MTCPEHLRTQSFLDGELNQTEAHEAQLHIETCEECRQSRAEADALGHYIRHDATRYSAPPSLALRVRTQLNDADQTRKPTMRLDRRSFWFGAAGGTGFSVLAAGLAVLMLLPPSSASLTEAVTDAHIRALMSGQTIEVASTNHHTVKPWFSGRVPLSPPVADFARDGFALVGGRVDEVAGAKTAVIIYRHGAHEIDLFVWPDRGSRLPTDSLNHGYHTAFWKSGDLDLAAVSDMQTSELEKFIRLVKAVRE